MTSDEIMAMVDT